MKSSLPVKQKPFLIMGIAAAGILLIVTAVVVILFFTGREPSIQGAWHNDDYQQVLRFDDKIVEIHSPSGEYVATFVFDAKSGDGVILFNDKSIRFYINGNSIFLISEKGEIEYVRGEIKGNVSATASPTPSVTDTSAVTTTPTPAVTSEAGETTPAVTDTSTPTPTATPTPTPTPTANPTSPIPTINPGLIFEPIDPIFPLLGTSVLGTWVSATDDDIHFEFFSNGKYTWINEGIYETTDIYNYNSFSGVGEFYGMESGWTPFTVDEDTLFVGTIQYNRS